MDAKVNSDLVVMDGFLANPSNYTYRIKGMNEQLQVSYPKTDDCKYSDFKKYYQNLANTPRKILTAKDEYALNNYRSHHNQIGQKLKPVQFDDAISSIHFKLNEVAHLKARWTSVVQLILPGLDEPFSIYLNYVLDTPDTFPFLPNIADDESLFDHLSISIDRRTTLDFVEFGDYKESSLPGIIYYDDRGGRTVLAPTAPPKDYFVALVDYFSDYVLTPMVKNAHQLSNLMLPIVFELLEDHILRSLKAAISELIKRSPLLCNPTSDYLFVLPCGVNSKRKAQYEQICDFELISMGNGSIEVNSQIRSCEWVEYRVNNQLLRRVKIRALNTQGLPIYQIKEFNGSTKL